MKKKLSALLIMTIIITMLPMTTLKTKAAGNSINDAIAINVDETVCNLNLDVTDGEEHVMLYSFKTSSDGYYYINAASIAFGVWMQMAVLDEYQVVKSEIKLNSVFLGANGAAFGVIKAEANKTYYIKVIAQPYLTITNPDKMYVLKSGYSFKITKESDVPFDSIGEDGFSIPTATLIKIGDVATISNPNYTENDEIEMYLTDFHWYRIDSSSNPDSVYHINIEIDKSVNVYLYMPGDTSCLRKKFDTSVSDVIEIPHDSVCYICFTNIRDKLGTFRVTEQLNKSKPAKLKNAYARAYWGKAVVKWENNKSASKFQVVYKERTATKWSSVIVDGKKLQVLLTNLNRRKYYSIKVRAIKIVNGESICGDWCKTINIFIP